MKKKQWYAVGGIIFALIIVIIGVFVANNQEKDSSTTEQTNAVAKGNPVNKSHYENLEGLTYEILKIEYNKEKHQLLLDIFTEEFLTNEQLKSLEDAVHTNVSKLVDQVDEIVIHVFNNKDTYKDAVNNGYKGGSGLVETVVGLHQEKVNVNATHYREIEQDENGDIDAVTYDVVGADDEGEEAVLDVVVEGNPKQVATFVSPFVQIIQDLNPNLKTVVLHIYDSVADVEEKNLAYVYQDSILSYTESLTDKEDVENPTEEESSSYLERDESNENLFIEGEVTGGNQ